MPDGGFEAGEEGFTVFATIEVLLQFLTKGIIELFIEVIGKLSEESFARGGPFFGSCCSRVKLEGSFPWSRRSVILVG